MEEFKNELKEILSKLNLNKLINLAKKCWEDNRETCVLGTIILVLVGLVSLGMITYGPSGDGLVVTGSAIEVTTGASATLIPSVTPSPTEEPTITATPTEVPTEVTVVPETPKNVVGAYDEVFIPDTHNCGCDESLLVEEPLGKHTSQYEGGSINWKPSSEKSGDVLALDLFYSNNIQNRELDIVIENRKLPKIVIYNFKGCGIGYCNITFRNCEIDGFGSIMDGEGLNFYFENCTITGNCRESYMHFSRCIFKDIHGTDCLNPLKNVSLSECYFAGFDAGASNGVHLDCIQYFGRQGILGGNIIIERCRFEAPMLPYTSSYVNACIMLQGEFSSIDNVYIHDCWVNGGGYTNYVHIKEKYQDTDLTMTNVVLDNIYVGSARAFGYLYPDISPNATIELVEQNNLLLTSVWEENGEIHFIASNDTDIDRCLRVEFEDGTFEDFSLKRCIGMRDIRYPNRKLSIEEDFDFDVEFTVEAKSGLVKFIDLESGIVLRTYKED